MMRIVPESFYWWLLALTGGAGWLAFSRRARLPKRAGEASIFAVALTVASSIYFFGRSHELNLLNVSAPFLFCTFLALDLAWPTEADDVPLLRGIFRVLPWAVVATCAYLYWARASERVMIQYSSVMTQSPVLVSNAVDQVDAAVCAEVAHAADDDQIFFFSMRDFWYYYHCRYVPPGYMQPMHLTPMKKPLLAEIKRLLASGYKIALPRDPGDEVASSFPEILAELPPLTSVETPHFQIYRQP
jgi:hypothetical protein